MYGTCDKSGCNSRRFMDSTHCFDHQFQVSGKAKAFGAMWFVFCLLIALATLGVGFWAVVSLVQWVTAK